jgi:hypothetical protein
VRWQINQLGAALVAITLLAPPSLAQAPVQPVKPQSGAPATEALPPVVSGKTVGWAIILPNGAIERSKNVIGNVNTGAGGYKITFRTKVDQCRYLATMTDNFGFVRVFRYNMDARGVIVETANTSGSPANRGFYLQVIC